MATEDDDMTSDREMAELYRLMSDDIFRTISQEDSSKLKVLLEQPWAWQEWVKFQQTFKNPSAIDNIAEIIRQSSAADLTKAIQRSTRQRNLLKASAAVVSVFALVMAVLYFPRQAATIPALPVAVAPPPAVPGLQLQLPGGEAVALQGRDTITTSHTTIYNDTIRRVLTYNSKDSSGGINALQLPAGLNNYTIVLSDGTSVLLHPGSELRFSFTPAGARREATLKGKAFFTVAKRKHMPFIVHVSHSPDIEVLGTSFNVNATSSDSVTVALREGLVQLTPAGGIPVRLKPGLQAVIQTASNSISVQPFNETETLAWMKEEYKLDNAPLSDLALILPHWLGIQVEIKDPRVAAVRFSGTILKSESIDSLSHRLQRLTGLTAVYQNGVLKISSTSKAQ